VLAQKEQDKRMQRLVSKFKSKSFLLYRATIVLFLAAGAHRLAAQQDSTQLSAARIHEIAGMLPKQPSGFGRTCSDRAAWSERSTRLTSFVDVAQQTVSTVIPAFDEQAYLAFTRTGDRQPMEKNANLRTNPLIPLVLAECAEYKGRYLSKIAEVIDSLVAAPSWTLSAHDAKLENLHGTHYYVDLNAANLADNIAEALYLLGDKIPAATRKHVMTEMERHVFGPMRQSLAKPSADGDHNGNWWLYATMNWNAVCLKGVTGAALAILPDVQDRALFVAGAERFIKNYEESFNPDGYDTEGLGYWNYGFSHFIELRENLFRVTNGKIDLLSGAKSRQVALFGIEFPMLPGNAAAFGDAGTRPQAEAHLVQTISHIFQISPEDSASQLKTGGIHHDGLTTIALDLFPVPGDELPRPAEVTHHDLQTYYADSGVLVSRPAPGQKLAVTIKAGGNTSHSHNDIGSFVIGLGNEQPVGDPGGPGFYTAATFGPQRLDSKLLNSFGHPVPEIDGGLQLDATKVKVKVTTHAFSPQEDRITIDMTPAYQVAQLKQTTRTLVHNRSGNGMVEVIDEFHLTEPGVIIESLPTHGTWEKIDDHTLLFTAGEEKLRVTIDAAKPVTFSETKVEYNGNAFTRVEAHIPVQGDAKISMRFAPEKP
jgi:hypothetical protein